MTPLPELIIDYMVKNSVENYWWFGRLICHHSYGAQIRKFVETGSKPKNNPYSIKLLTELGVPKEDFYHYINYDDKRTGRFQIDTAKKPKKLGRNPLTPRPRPDEDADYWSKCPLCGKRSIYKKEMCITNECRWTQNETYGLLEPTTARGFEDCQSLSKTPKRRGGS